MQGSNELDELLTPKVSGAPIVDRDARILILDIERLPGLARVWEPKTRYIAAHNFTKWPSLLCFAARWYGHRTPIFESLWDEGLEGMVRGAWNLYNEADIVVGYNSKRFDNRHLKSDWLTHGFPPPTPWKDVDLYDVIKQFGFEAKSLDTVSKRLGRPGKLTRYNIDLAEAAAAGDAVAQRKLRRYNIGDIEMTEWLYDRLRGWMPSHPFPGSFGEDNRCNQCGGDDLTLQPTQYRAVVLDYALYRCDACGANIRGGWHSRAANTRGVR